MKSFLLNKFNKPTILWSLLEDGIFYEGNLPSEDYALAVVPGIEYIVLDIDNKPGKVNGIENIPADIYDELFNVHFNYPSKSGFHVWMKYLGDKILLNRATKFGLDLRVNNKGYVKWYPKEDVRDCLHLIKPASNIMNNFLENLFSNDREIT